MTNVKSSHFLETKSDDLTIITFDIFGPKNFMSNVTMVKLSHFLSQTQTQAKKAQEQLIRNTCNFGDFCTVPLVIHEINTAEDHSQYVPELSL